MIAVSIEAGRILHKLSLLEKKNLESEIEFLPRPCRWCFQGWFTGSGANRQNRLRSSPALTFSQQSRRPVIQQEPRAIIFAGFFFRRILNPCPVLSEREERF